jgi:hypothetical protein
MDKIGNGVLAICAVVCIAAAFIGSFGIPGLALGTAVTVNAPEYVEGTFNVTIDVESITNFNSGQFDLSFDSHVVNVTGVADGSIGGETVPVDRWELMEEDRIRVIPDLSGIAGVNGSGYLAEIGFDVVGSRGERSVLDISDGMLVDTEADAIPAAWIDAEITVGVDEGYRTGHVPEHLWHAQRNNRSLR